MSEPVWIECGGEADAPDAEAIERMLGDDRHVVLRFAPGSLSEEEKRRVMRRLVERLPNCSVFDAGAQNGAERITIMRVISEAVVLANADAIVEAARLFRRIARERIAELAAQFGVRPDAFADGLFRFGLEPGQSSGTLPSGWKYYFHGLECAFGNPATGQGLDVRLGFGEEFGVLDPYFFARFVASTPELQTVARLFRNDYHDPKRALEILEKRGLFRRVISHTWERVGLAVAPN